MRFTDRSITSLKPKAARYEAWEDGRTGFGVRVAPIGRKSWVYMYRFDGKARRMTFGPYPRMSLADARVKLAEAKRKLDRGIDPGAEAVKARRAERQAETVQELVDEYLAKWARPRKRSAAEDERCLNSDVLPYWGHRKAKSITRRDVIVCLDRVMDRGSPVMANRLLAIMRRMFGFGVERDILEVNPCIRIRAPGEEVSRDRVLTETELVEFWRGLDHAKMSDQVRLALRLMVVTAQRRSEATNAEWTEFDLDHCLWVIPKERAKNGIAHEVPLSALALEVLEGARVVGVESRWLFPSPKVGGRPIVPAAINHALAVNRDIFKIANFRPHDLRRTVASHLTALGVPRLVVGKILNHSERQDITSVYDRHDYREPKRLALAAWGSKLEELLSAKPAPENVVRLKHG